MKTRAHRSPQPKRHPAGRIPGLLAPLSLLPLAGAPFAGAQAFDINDQFSIGGIIAAAGQCQDVSARLPGEGYGTAIEDSDPLEYNTDLDQFGNECRGGMPVQIEMDFRPNSANQFFIALGWAVDNALNTESPFRLAPWAADLEDDVEDINGRGRDYLLQAWYKHTVALADDNSIGASFGILDSTAYLDHNEYANDEYTQFMNEAFVNAGNYNLPSYDAGIAVEMAFGDLSFNAVGMNIGENDDGNNYNFWGAQIGWHPQLQMGQGNYRVNITGTSAEFLGPTRFVAPDVDPDAEQDLVLINGQARAGIASTKRESLLGWGLSFDQAVGQHLGLFLRLSWQNTDAAVDYEALYSGGIDISGGAWQRPDDNIGLGFAYLEGGNADVRNTSVFEGYYRASINDHLAITADIQYLSDDLVQFDPQQEDPSGWIFGLRATAEF